MAGSTLLMGTGQAHAQNVDSIFPPSIPGFDRQQGVTVLSRLRPLYEQPGIRLGSFVVNGGLDERAGYDTNVTGTAGGKSSAVVRSSPAVSAASDWSRNRLGLAVGMDDFRYLDAPRQSYTNYNASIGGGYTIGRSDLNVGYSHFRLHELGTDIAAIATTTPIQYDVDAIRGDYTFETGRFKFIPNFDVRLYQFGDATVAGQPSSQRFRDRTVTTGGLTTRFGLSDQRSLVLAVQGSSSQYIRPQSGQPSNNSKSVLVLTGLDYQATGPWRYQVLGGVEAREFRAAQFGTRVAPIIVANVIWTPTGLTTLTGTIRRQIEDPQAEGTSGYTLTTLQLVADHELYRNVLLQGRGAFQAAEYLQGGGSTTSYSLGAGATWLVNRRLRLSADYDFTQQTGSSNTTLTQRAIDPFQQTGASNQLNFTSGGSYNRNLMLIGLHIGL